MQNKAWIGIGAVVVVVILISIGYVITDRTYYCESRGIVMECERFSASGNRCYPNLLDNLGYRDCSSGWIKLSDYVNDTNKTEPEPVLTHNLTRTASTETICYEDGTCNLILFSGTRFAYEDDTWKKVENAKSLKNAWKVVKLKDDSDHAIEVLDFNYTSITLNFSFVGNPDDYEYEVDDNKIKIKFKIKEIVFNGTDDVEVETETEIEIEDEEKVVYSGNPLGKKFSLGEHSTTIQLQDADTENLDDAYVKQSGPDRNYGIAVSIFVVLETSFGNTFRSYIKFNISGIPSGQTIDEAILFTYPVTVLTGDAPNISVHHVYNNTWVEGTEDDKSVVGQSSDTNITWNNQPCGIYPLSSKCNGTPEDYNTKQTTGEWYNWTVTNAVDYEYTNSNENVSLLIKVGGNDTAPGSDNTYWIFRSKEYTDDISLRPYLNITYSLFVDPTAPDNVGFLYPTPANDTNLSQDNYFVNVSFHDANPDWCELELTNTSGTINYTMVQGANSSEYYLNTTHTNNMTYFLAYCNDTAGNWNHSETRFVNISKIYPIVTLYNVSTDTTDRTPSIEFLTINDEITTSCYLYFDDVAYDVNASVKNNTQTTLTVNETLDWGSYSVYVKCSDATGTGTSATITIELSDLYFGIENATGDIVWKVDDEGVMTAFKLILSSILTDNTYSFTIAQLYNYLHNSTFINTSGNQGSYDISTTGTGTFGDLDVTGEAYIGSATEKILIKDDGVAVGLIGYDGSGFNPIHIRAGSGNQLYLDTSSNIGIGAIASASHRLTIEKSVVGACSTRTYNSNSGGYAIHRVKAGAPEMKFVVYGPTYATAYYQSVGQLLADTDITELRIVAQKSDGIIVFQTGGQLSGDEKMRIDTDSVIIGATESDTLFRVAGNATIDENLTAENVWLPTYCFAHTADTQNITGAGVWLNVSFDEQASLCTHMTHTHSDSTNDTFTIQNDGVYDISYHMTFSDTAPSPSGHIEMRVIRNATEILGSLLEEDSSKQYNDFTLSNGILVKLTVDDRLIFQFTSDDTTVGMSSHAAYGDHRDTGVIKIRRIG